VLPVRRQTQNLENSKNRIKFGGVDSTTHTMHPGTLRGLTDCTMVKEAIRIGQSDRGVAEFASSGRLLASNETPFDRKNSSFSSNPPSPMLCIHPTQPKYTSRDKKMSGPLSYEHVTYQNTEIRPPSAPERQKSPAGAPSVAVHRVLH
jgi:hypothetical protein